MKKPIPVIKPVQGRFDPACRHGHPILEFKELIPDINSYMAWVERCTDERAYGIKPVAAISVGE